MRCLQSGVFAQGVKLDFRERQDGYVVNADDVEAELKRDWARLTAS